MKEIKNGEKSLDAAFERNLYNALKHNGSELVTKGDLLDMISAAGIAKSDERIASLLEPIANLGIGDEIAFEEFYRITRKSLGLISRIIKHELIIPHFNEFCLDIEAIYAEIADNQEGALADYIPQLALVEPNQFGISICTVDGQVFSLGDSKKDFCIQSISKPINYAIALEQHGESEVHGHVGWEPSGMGFNEIMLNSKMLPHNPMINAGGIVCTALIDSDKNMAERFETIMCQWERLAGGRRPGYNNSVYNSELETADRNFALAHYMREMGALNKSADIKKTLDIYFQTCSIELNTRDLANAGAVFANAGVCPRTGTRMFSENTVRDSLSMMYSCGMYDFSGEYAFTVGLPAKSGVSGGLMIVIPNLMGIAVWSPRLDKLGNSVRGVEFSKALVKRFNFHNFDSLQHSIDKKDPRNNKAQDANMTYAMINAASQGDLDEIKRISSYGIPLDRCDYDKRTPLHLAAAEGQLHIVKYLQRRGVEITVCDRWDNTPLDDARKHGHEKVAAFLESKS